jgi:SAM-dependent methyltransferase
VIFKDHFSKHAADYAKFRPRYPNELFAYLASISPSRQRAWDCATGNGQAAIALAAQFDIVIATDASTKQIENAPADQRVEYRVAAAEESGLESDSIDLITVAQALHWFDLSKFWAEAKRVLKPQGVLACWSYNVVSVAPEIDRITDRFYRKTVGPFWPPERAIVEAGYRTIDFPFHEIVPPLFRMETRWTLDQLLGYLRTWSATQKFIAANNFDPVGRLENELAEIWQPRDAARTIAWPLSLRVGRV